MSIFDIFKRRPAKQGDREIRLIVGADEPALFFTSVEAAERYLEWIDVEDGVYHDLYDDTGQPYRIRAVGQRVIIEPDLDRAPEPEKLRAFLLRVCRGIDIPAEASDDLATLLERCRPYINY